MYQILIADDEKGYCDLLEKSINRMEGFHVVGKAYDGERAAQLAEELHPDILITDINMPKLSGLDLLRRVQGVDPNMETLVISGYSDFSYAKGAIALGVNDYLVKPFLPDELHDVLNRMSHQIETRKNLAENMRQLQAEANFNREEARRRYLTALMKGENTDIGEAASLGLELDRQMYCVCVVCLRPSLDNIADIIRDGYFAPDTVVYGVSTDEKTTALLLAGNADSEVGFYRELESELKRVSSSLEGYYNTHMWSALGNIYHHPEQIADSYREAYAVWRSKLTEDERVVSYGMMAARVTGSELRRPIELENRLLRLILSAEDEKAIMCLHQIIDHYSGYCLQNPEFVSVSLVKLVFSISEVTSRANNGQVTEDAMVLDYLKHHFTRSRLTDATLVLEKYIRSACALFRPLNVEHTDKLVIVLKELIEKNLSNEDFNLESAASQMYFSANYIRQLFKQKVGESFMEYLIRRRMETARSLLTESSMQIQKIAEQTGYSNSRYFASCFKKYYNCTPTECRAGAPTFHNKKDDKEDD